MQDPRERLQQEAKAAWLESDRKNTIVVPTGSGKSKIAIDILKEFFLKEYYVNGYDKILLLTNSTLLRDENWKKEFDKWGYRWESIESECYQTAYKWVGRKFDLVIADELDFIAEEYKKFFDNNECKIVLGMTGFVTEEKEAFINSFLPICYKAEVQDLQEAGILNKSEFIFVKYPLSKQKTIEQKKRDGGKFMTSENDQYKYYDKEYHKAMIVKANLEKKYRLMNVIASTQADWKAADWNFKIKATKRKSILNNLDSSIKVTQNLINKIHQEEGHKILIFSSLTKQCDKLPNPFHGKNEQDNTALDKLNSGEIKEVAVVKKVNRGVNLVGVDTIIYESYDGSETSFVQTHGRGLRLRPDQTLKVYILIPVFEEMVRQVNGSFTKMTIATQARNWADKMTASFNLTNSKTITLKEDLNIERL